MPRLIRAALLLPLAALLLPNAARAQSTGCAGVNAGYLNSNTVFSRSGTTTTVQSSSASGRFNTTWPIQYMRASGYADPNVANYSPSNTSFFTFDPGDVISYSATVSDLDPANPGSSSLFAGLRIGTGTSGFSGPVAYRLTRQTNGTSSTSYQVAAGNTAIGLFAGHSTDGVGGRIVISASCTPAAAPPTLASFTVSNVAYNPGTNATTNIDVPTRGGATNSPTSYSVATTSSGSFGGTAATSGGGTVTINTAGQATYTPPQGYRGNDSFFVRATNSGGSSAPATVTVQILDPTIAATLTGTGAKAGTPLSGYAVTPSGGAAPYGCVLSTGSNPLPSGVTLDPSCALTGTPQVSGTFAFTVDITDSSRTGTNGGTPSPFTQTSVPITNFTIGQDAPTVTAVVPAIGPTTGGTNVTVTGTNFYGVTEVRFGTTPATSFTPGSGTSLTAVAPGGSGTVNILVITAAGTSAAGAASQFVYSNPPAQPIVNVPGQNARVGASPSYQGATEANTVVTVYVDNASIGNTPADVNSWVLAQPTPLAPGPHTVYVIATNANGQASAPSSTINFEVIGPPVASNYAGPAVAYNAGANTATAFSIAGQASNDPTSYAVSSPSAGGGTVAIDNAGLVTYTPAIGFRGTDTFTYTASNAGGTSAPATVSVTVNNPVLSATLSGSGTRGQPLSGVQITPSGGRAGYTCAATPASGTLPAGTSVDSSCAVVGTPDASGTFTFAVTVTDSSTPAFSQTSNDLTLTITPPTLTLAPASGALADGVVGTSYTVTFAATGGSGGFAYAVTSGTPPDGLTLTNGGVLSGRPTQAGSFNFNVTATDSSTVGSGGPYQVTNSYSIQVAAQAPVAGGVSATVAYNSSGNPIPLALSGGAATSVAVATQASNGTATPSGTTITYTPNPGYYGSDSFTYTATGPGGTSPPATVTITVNPPAAPTAADVSGIAVPYGSAGTAIDLSSAISGVHSSVNVTTPPANGTFSVSGDVVTYTPTAGYAGPDSFVYVAVGPGGSSNAATVSLTVTAAAPVVADRSENVPYNSPGTAIDLSSSISGVHTSVAVVSAPAHGTVSVSGDVVTYTPTAGYYGADSFTFTASGPGGTSNVGTVAITVATPAAPTVTDRSAAIPYNSAGTAIDLSGAISGVHSSIAVASGPTSGTVSVSGDVVTYTPNAGFFGADSFTYTATGPGGTSAPATVSLTVATPAAPTAADRSAAVPYNSPGTAIDLSGAISGVHSSIAVATGPTSGTVSVSGDVVTYTPTAGFFGGDSFTYTATGPGGTSAPAAVSITIATPAAPTAADRSAAVPYNSPGTAIDLSGAISGVHSSIAVASGPANGSVSVSGDVVTYTPTAGFFGADSFTYTATGPGGTSAPATVSLTVATPAAPTAADRSAAVPYNSAGTAIDLSGAVSGVHTSIAVTSGPANGTASVSGDVVTYTPTPGFYGPDSFTYVASGPGGSSAPATVRVEVARPAAPMAADVSNAAVPFNSSGTAIDLSSYISGVHDGVAIALNPAHGTVSVAGDVVTYVPATGYYGVDSFAYTASGPGGTSNQARVTLQVAMPPPPTAAAVSNVAVPYNSSGTPIDLTSAIGGVHSSVSIATNPAHGSVTVSGNVVTYVPTAGYYVADSFSYTATGPGGTSSPAAVTLQVALPAAPTAADRNDVAVPYNGAGTPIDLAGEIAGVYSGISIATAPAHGSATVSGTVVTYVPAANYHGADSFTYVVTGPGGSSAPATVRLTVAPPPPPVATGGSGTVAASTQTAGMQSVAIDLSALVTGEYSRIEIATQPAHGSVTLSGNPGASGGIGTLAGPRVIATYTPAMGFVGTDSFAFAAVGPGGRSAPASVTVTVVGQVPVALPKTAAIGDGQTVSVMLTDGAIGGPFTGATVVSVTPANQVSATIVASGSGASQAYRLDVTPAARFGGTAVIAYTLRNAYGVSAPATVTVTVTARPDPTADPNIRAISDAQAEATRRFARGQVANFMRRTEQLHGDGAGTGGAEMGVTLNPRDGRGIVQAMPAADAWALEITERMRPAAEDPALARVRAGASALHPMPGDQFGRATSPATLTAAERNAARKASGMAGEVQPLAADSEQGDDGTRRTGSIGIWSGGAVDIGTQDATDDRSKITATTAGLSAGADVKLAEGITVGLGGGYSNDFSRIAGNTAWVRSNSSLLAAYASVSPVENGFVDAMIGRGDLSFRTRRLVAETGAVATGDRDGAFTVGALALGIDRRSDVFNWSLYGRGELLDARLGGYVENGADRYNLRFDERQLTSITGTLGARFEWKQKLDFATVLPRLRLEWNHEFADADAQRLDYADIGGAALYGIDSQGWAREQFQLGLGSRFVLPSLWSFDLETVFRGSAGQRSGTVRVQIGKEF